MAAPYFTPEVFKFIRELRANNDRDWFKANKDRYEDEVRQPALRFITDFGSHLAAISPHFRSDPRPNGGSLFRIYRDIRFSKNKDPYKDHVGLHFRHEAGKDAYTPGFYLHLAPRGCFVGVGLWHPDNPTLKLIRDYLVNRPGSWDQAVGTPGFAKNFEISGRSLVRPPKGFDPEHPLIDVLKFKDFTAYAPLTQKQVTGRDFMDEFAGYCQQGGALVRFICQAVGQKF